jgi:hypothetical protein
MANNDNATERPAEPRGFGEHTRGLAGEYAHEQGWGLDEQERTRQPRTPQDTDGGTNYEYGAQDFGDVPVNADTALNARDKTQNTPSAPARERKKGNQP